MLIRMLAETVARHPDKAAVVQGARRISYRELQSETRFLAGRIARLGARPRDTVALLLPNGPDFVAAFFAVARLGAVTLPLNPAYTADELRRYLRDTPAKVLVTNEAGAALARAAGHEGALVFADLRDETAPDPAPVDDENVGGLYLYTSGSTDSFKRIRCTPRNLYYEARNFVDATKLTASDTILCAVPLHHSYGLGNGLLDAAFAGASLVLESEPEAPFITRQDQLLRLIVQERASVFLGVPFQYERLIQTQAGLAAAFADVKWCVSSGDVLPRRVFEAFRAQTGQPIRSLYGSTEAGSIAIDLRPAEDVDGETLGAPLAYVEIEIRGEAGEIWVKSPTLPPDGYENRPKLTDQIFRDGFYNTGDLGHLVHGRLHMSGRKQSFFNVGGHKVDLGEVEEALLSAPGVREAAAVGVEVTGLGGVIKAVVAADGTTRESDLIAHCRARLASFKAPRFVEFRDVLPRGPLGKILRAELAVVDDWRADIPHVRNMPEFGPLQQVEWLATHIAVQVGAILRVPPERLPKGEPFQSLGFDSLRTVELQQRLSAMFGLSLSLTTLWNYPSIDAYAAFVRETMREKVGEASTREIAELSDEEVAEALASELARSACR